jgi:hypothetical protein
VIVSTEQGRHRLQRYLADEVDRRGRTWAALGAEIGDNRSASTIRSYVQAGVAARPQRSTLAMVDRLLGWEAGSARAVLEGGEPRLRMLDNDLAAAPPRGSDEDDSEPNGAADPLPALSGAKWERLTAEQQRAVLGVIDSMLEGD